MEQLKDLARLRLIELIFKNAKFQNYLVAYMNSGTLNKQKYRQRFGKVIEELELKRVCHAEFRMHNSNLERVLANMILPVILSTDNMFTMITRYVTSVGKISDAHLLKFLTCLAISKCSRRSFSIDTARSCENIINIDSLIEEEKFLFYCLFDKHKGLIEFSSSNTTLSFAQKFEVAIICNAGHIVIHLWSNASEDEKNALLQTHKEKFALQLASVIGTEDVVGWFLNRDISASAKNPTDKNSLLHIAAKSGNVLVMEILIEKKADVNAKNIKGETPVHLAAEGGFRNAIELLWNNKSEWEPISKDGNTPLHTAVENGQVKVVNFLLKANADIKAKNHQKSTALHIAAIKGNLELVELLLKNGARADVEDSFKQTPIHKACHRDFADIADILIKVGKASLNVREGNTTVLHNVVTRGHLQTTLVLLEGGADPNSRDETGKTSLHLAAYHGHYSIVMALLWRNANPFAQDNRKETPLHGACKKGYVEIVELLLDKGQMHYPPSCAGNGMPLVNYQDQNGRTPIHLASRSGHEAVVRCLLTVEGIKFLFDNKLRSALHEAAWQGYIEIVLLLKNHSGMRKLINSKDHRGATALQLAINFNHTEVVYYLQDATTSFGNPVNSGIGVAQPTSNLSKRKHKRNSNINGKNDSGETALHVAVITNDVTAVKALLLDKMLKINAKTSKNETALHLAVKHGCISILKLLLRCRNIDANAANDDGETPLHCVMRTGNVDLLKVFFCTENMKKVKVNPRNSSQAIPLHLAVENGNIEVLKLLLTRSVEFNARTSSGKTAVQIACEKGNKDVFIMVLKLGNWFATDVRDSDGNTLLHLAIKNRHSEITRYILSNFTELLDLTNHNGDTCLHLAVRNKQVNLVKTILLSYGHLANVPNNCLETPLLLAASMTKVPKRIIECLLKSPGINVNAKLLDDRTVLHLFIAKLSTDLVELLLKTSIDIGAKDRNGYTALHVWVQKMSECYMNLYNIEHPLEANKFKIFEKMLSCSKSNNIVNVQDSNGNSVLHLSALTGIIEILGILLKVKDVDVNLKNNFGETALHLACMKGHFQYVERILEVQSINIDIKCGFQSQTMYLDFIERDVLDYQPTALAFAMKNGHWDIVRLMIRKDANVNIKIDAYGTTALDFTKEEGQSEIVELIKMKMPQCKK